MTDPAPLDPAPFTPADPLPGLPKPIDGGPALALSPGRAANDHAGPAFDAAAVAAQMPPRPPTASHHHDDGEFRDPTQPLAPPTGVEVPEDHAAAMAEFDRLDAAWRDAVDAVADYRDTAQASRAAEAAAIRDASAAVHQGKRRPPIPAAISEEAEAREVAVLSGVVDRCRAEASTAARKADQLAEKYAPQYAAAMVERWAPQLEDAADALQAAAEKVAGAEALLDVIAVWRSLEIAAGLKKDGVRVSEHQRMRIAGDLLESSKTQLYRSAERYHRSPADLLGQARDALGQLRRCDPTVVPGPDTIYLPGGFAQSRDAWRRIWADAPEESKQRYRDRYHGGRPLAHETEA
ncbi:hypothetical protein [Micromonospora aurantiaca (nom. illeg.)]|uniref:hypothetical protein n=1 Tax=Micromonospora aurantiaca (nom. illeg.) TaxID=47850 RepID=UPI0001BF28CE|nr:hypothetical protein [Micromonospora aurantiaca]ADL48486.1 hypothetical protein Micau_4978 [Micromonospora aurantiaca ATCC 27029]